MPEDRNEPTILLGFDFGLKAMGVSVGQTLTKTANGVATLSMNNGKPKWYQVEQLIKDYQPTRLVVGLPLNMDGSNSEMSGMARTFAEKLATRSGLPVALQDERLTSKAADAGLEEARELGTANTDHELAANIILTDWMSAR